MLGDVLLITERHHRAAAVLFDRIMSLRTGKQRFTVGISGESGSGKTELAHVLAKRLCDAGVVAKPIHIDNFYKVHPLERSRWRVDHGVEDSVGLDEYDWDAIGRFMEDFACGREATMPCIDLVTQRVDRLITDFGQTDMLIVDGLYAIATEELDLRVFIDLTYHETKKAQALRGKEQQNELRWQVLEQEHRVVQSLRPRADLLVTADYEVLPA